MKTKLALIKNDTVSLLPQIEELKDDLRAAARSEALAIFATVRVGIRLHLMSDQTKHGDLETFWSGALAGFDVSYKTGLRWRDVGRYFLRETGYITEKTGWRFRDDGDLKSLMSTQLELFAGHGPSLEGAARTLADWVGTKSITDLYREARRPAGGLPPDRTGKSSVSSKSKHELRRARVSEAFRAFHQECNAGNWRYLGEDDMQRLSVLVAKLDADMAKHFKEKGARKP